MLKRLIHRIWNFEFREGLGAVRLFVVALIFLGGVIYVSSEVLFGMNSLAGGFSVFDISWSDIGEFSSRPSLEEWFPTVWLGLAVFSVVLRLTIIIQSYFQSKKVLGIDGFDNYMVTYFSAFSLATALSFALMFFMYGLMRWAGFELNDGANVLTYAVNWLASVTDAYVPTLFEVHSYWLAIFLSLFLSALPGYFVHWLGHRSRFFWYVFHRCHHCPEFLHPMGAPPAFAFDFLLVFPTGLIAMVTSKLIYTEPLVMEMGLWFTFAYAFEIFNHSIVHYDFAYRNPIVRNICRLIGDRGVYHLMHHSAKPKDQTINLGGSPFLFWDRLFGTYRKPYQEAPPVGLTNQPKLKLNPFRIILSGIAQLWYELRENQDWKTRLLVVFGPIHYMPPKTKEYLMSGY